jgi:hypothetical protein
MIPAEVYSVRAPASGLTIELTRGVTIRGFLYLSGPYAAPSVTAEPTGIRARIESVPSMGSHTIRGFVFDGLPPGTYDLVARAPGYVDARRRVEVPEHGEIEPVPLELERGPEVTLRVADEFTDEAIPGAEIAIFEPEGRDLVERHRVIADGEGVAAVHLAPGLWVAQAEKDGYMRPGKSPYEAFSQNELFRVDGDKTRTLVLRRRLTIRGRVVLGDGSPARARVRVADRKIRSDVASAPTEVVPTLRSTVTDRDGAYTLEGAVGWGEYTIRADGSGPDNFDVQEGVRIPEGETVAVVRDLRVAGGGHGIVVEDDGSGADPEEYRIHGRVTDESGRPIAGALVRIGYPTVTDAEGIYEIVLSRTTFNFVYVAAPGLPPAAFDRLRVRDPETRLDLVVPSRGVLVMGTVRDTASGPIAGARLTIRFTGVADEFRAVTNHMGHYEIEGPSVPVVRVSVTARATGYADRTVDDQASDKRVVDIVLERLVNVTVPLDLEGEVPAGVVLAVRDGNRKYVPYPCETLPVHRRVVCRGVPPGRPSLRIEVPGFAPVLLPRHDLPEGEDVTLEEVALAEGGVVRGVAVDAGDEPLAGHIVRVDETDQETETSEAGTFELERVPPGTVTLVLGRRDVTRFRVLGRQTIDVRDREPSHVKLRAAR